MDGDLRPQPPTHLRAQRVEAGVEISWAGHTEPDAASVGVGDIYVVEVLAEKVAREDRSGE